jgi:hypothetical protein
MPSWTLNDLVHRPTQARLKSFSHDCHVGLGLSYRQEPSGFELTTNIEHQWHRQERIYERIRDIAQLYGKW